MKPFPVAELVKAVGGVLRQGSSSTVIRGVSADSRLAAPGHLFVGLKGLRQDGSAFAGEAVARGAVAVLTGGAADRSGPPGSTNISPAPPASFSPASSTPAPAGSDVLPAGVAVVEVPDPLAALGLLAKWYTGYLGPAVVGVTGSTGKTTTKDMIIAALDPRYRVAGSPGNFNTEIGLPLSLLGLEEGCQVAVLEMGMRGPGQIRQLGSIATPSIGVITNIGETHLELLGSLEAIAVAKLELLETIREGGWAVLNGDDPRLARAAEAPRPHPALLFGLEDRCRVRAEGIRELGTRGIAFTLAADQTPGWEGRAEVSVPVPGRHNVYNALAAAACGIILGMAGDEIARGLAGFRSGALRMEVITAPAGYSILNDSYNANPTSMKAALETLRGLAGDGGGRAAAVLGDMLELGSRARDAHLELGLLAARLGLAFLVGVGPLGAVIVEGALRGGLSSEAAVTAPDTRAAVDAVRRFAQAGDWILIKGSRGMRMEEIAAGLAEAGLPAEPRDSRERADGDGTINRAKRGSGLG